MRRKQQRMDDGASVEMLRRCTSGVLSLIDADGEPYGVPLSYAIEGGRIYFHCATAGRKLDAVRHCGKASFCVIGRDDVIAEKFTTAFQSVIVRGNIVEVNDDGERIAALRLLAEKYSPEMPTEAVEREISGSLKHVVILALKIEEVTGKQAKELIE